MQAAFLYEAGDVRVQDAPAPAIEQPTDAVVRIIRSSVCGSDLPPYHPLSLRRRARSHGP